MEYNLTRSKRRSISIHVKKDASIEVRAPLKMPLASIESFVNSKDSWIQKHVDEILTNSSYRDSFFLDFGKTVLVRGKPYLILPLATGSAHLSHSIDSPTLNQKTLLEFNTEISRHCGLIFVPEKSDSDMIIGTIRSLLINYAKEFIVERTSYFSSLLKVEPCSVRIGNAKTRWGSCNSKGRINYNWKIIMCDDSVIDYIVIHELSHLIHMNHSKSFWNEVKKFAPNYAECRRTLKTFQTKLNQEKW